MDYRVLALKYRPTRFEEVVGQTAVTEVLAGAIAQGRLAQAYLFAGPRGCGKTTTARLLAMALNCERGPTPSPCGECAACRGVIEGSSLAVIVVDAASAGKVDDIRTMRAEAALASIGGRYKIYILDEAHQITRDGADALLKTLEEPPPATVFVLATTEPQKILPTIHSRCQRFSFRLLGAAEIAARLTTICEREGIAAEEAAIQAIARRADGSMRDGITLLDQALAAAGGKLELEALTRVLGLTRHDHYFALDEAWRARDAAAALRALAAVLDGGLGPREFAHGLAGHLRDLLFLRVDPALLAESLPAAERERCADYAADWQVEDLLALLRLVSERADQIRYASQPRLLLDALVVEIACFERRVLLTELLGRLRAGRAEPGPERGGGSRPAAPGARRSGAPADGGERLAPAAGAPAAAAGRGPAAASGPSAAASSGSSAGAAGAPAASSPARATAAAVIPLPEPAALWGEFVQQVSRSMKSLGSFLEQARPGVLGEKHYSIVVQSPFHLAMLDTPEHLRLMSDTLGRLVGRPRQIRLELASGAPPPERVSPAQAEAARRHQALDDHAGSPLIQDLLQRFDGELLED